jgi:peptidyl-prolyl cis-trans isomerase C
MYSIDPEAKQTGGEATWVNLAQLPPPVAQSVSSLSKGQYTKQPLSSQMGYHIFKVEDIRAPKVPSFDQAKPMIEEQMKQQKVGDLLRSLREKEGIVSSEK